MDLETYLERHSNTQPSKGITINEHISRVEYFCYENLDLFKLTVPAYKNILVRDDEIGQTFGRISIASTQPELSVLRVVSRDSYKRDPLLYKTAFLNASEYLSLRFNRVVKATLMTCAYAKEGYKTSRRTWLVNGKEILEPRRRDFRKMNLALQGNRLVKATKPRWRRY